MTSNPYVGYDFQVKCWILKNDNNKNIIKLINHPQTFAQIHKCVCLYMLSVRLVAKMDRRKLRVVFIDLCCTRLSASRAAAQQETSSVTDPYHPQTLR